MICWRKLFLSCQKCRDVITNRCVLGCLSVFTLEAGPDNLFLLIFRQVLFNFTFPLCFLTIVARLVRTESVPCDINNPLRYTDLHISQTLPKTNKINKVSVKNERRLTNRCATRPTFSISSVFWGGGGVGGKKIAMSHRVFPRGSWDSMKISSASDVYTDGFVFKALNIFQHIWQFLKGTRISITRFPCWYKLWDGIPEGLVSVNRESACEKLTHNFHFFFPHYSNCNTVVNTFPVILQSF